MRNLVNPSTWSSPRASSAHRRWRVSTSSAERSLLLASTEQYSRTEAVRVAIGTEGQRTEVRTAVSRGPESAEASASYPARSVLPVACGANGGQRPGVVAEQLLQRG